MFFLILVNKVYQDHIGSFCQVFTRIHFLFHKPTLFDLHGKTTLYIKESIKL